jgi:hypothetical protein
MILRKLSLAVLLAVFAAGAAPLHAETNVLFIFDSSGSMKKKVDNGEARMTVAKRVMAQTLKDMPADVRLGLLLYGHRRAKDCTDIELASPIGADDAPAIARRIADLKPKGETPIAAALEQAIRAFAALKGQSNRVVIVTDGIEECGGDVCAAAQTVADAGLDLRVDVVGFTLNAQQGEAIHCIAEKTGGQYYEAKNVQALTAAMAQVTQQVQTAAAVPKDESLIAAANGGVLVAAPNDEWRKLNDGATERATTYNGEGIWSFKDGKPATFDSFEVLIPAADQYNLKDFELLAGDDGPLGAFRSIGVFSTQNIKMMQAPYQRFTFPPVTARYLKVVLRADWGGGYIAAYEFRLLGKLDESAAATPPAAAASGVDLLSPANGGALLAAPNDEWSKLNDGKPDRATTYSGEGVWGFRDGKPATFDRFEILIPGTDQYNVHQFELFAGDDGPTGPFRSIGVFNTQNIQIMQAPYQAFTFAPVTAKYLKVALQTDWGGGYIAAYDIRLFGAISEAAAAATTAAPAPAPTSAGIDLLSPANGGALIAAPNDEWAKLNDGQPDRATTYAGEGVWGFKDGKPATFDRFEMLIPGADQYNVRQFELLAGDDSPTGAFRSIGVFTTQNTKLMQSPYQAFSFPPVTAKYFKVALQTDWGGGYIAAYDIRLFGTIGEAGATSAAAPTTSTAAATASAGVDLLSPANGGALIAAPNDEWLKLNNGKPDRATTYAGEGIWGFKDGKPATFGRFEMLIPGADQYNVRQFELFVGDDGPGGQFRSIGVFTTQNTKLMQSPYQAFTFPAVTAKFFKVALQTDWGGGYVAAYDFRLIGSPVP